MRALGSHGGQRGGPARARSLSASRRSEIAGAAARARWRPELLVLRQPRGPEELHCFVAQYGNGLARHAENCDPAAVLIQAIGACRGNACLARMLPVFVWRARDKIFADPDRLLPAAAKHACTLGYFLELTGQLGGFRVDAKLINTLRRRVREVAEPFVLFRVMDRPFLHEIAAERTSELARSWKLVMGEPDDSFESYFQKKVRRESL